MVEPKLCKEHLILFVKCERNHLTVLSVAPISYNLFNKISWFTVPNAFLKSTKATQIIYLSSCYFSHPSITSVRDVSVEWKGQKPDWCWLSWTRWEKCTHVYGLSFDDLAGTRENWNGPTVICGLQIIPFMKEHNFAIFHSFGKTPADKDKFIITDNESKTVHNERSSKLKYFAANIIKSSDFLSILIRKI